MIATGWVAAVLVFGTVVALVLWLVAIISGSGAEKMRMRLMALRDGQDVEQAQSVIRARYLRQLSPMERWLEELPGMAGLSRLSEQAGRTAPAYRTALLSAALAFMAAIVAGGLTRGLLAPVVAAIVAGALPLLKLLAERRGRIAKFDEQLPDALDLMARSLRAGNPMMDAIKFVFEEMPPPIAHDFERVWAHINFGVSLKTSLEEMLERTPSVSLRAMATAILVQRETGGNLAEILDKISHVLRARARFARRLKTLSAEGRMSAVFLSVTPFALAGVLALTSPTYLPMLTGDEAGRNLIMAGVTLMAFGIFWISRIVRIRV